MDSKVKLKVLNLMNKLEVSRDMKIIDNIVKNMKNNCRDFMKINL